MTPARSGALEAIVKVARQASQQGPEQPGHDQRRDGEFRRHFGRNVAGPDAVPDDVPDIQRYTTIGAERVALGDFSHALLGVLDGIAVPAGLALKFLSRGDGTRYLEIMGPCEELGRWLFREPTSHYKAGLAFLAWLNGLQDNFMLVNREDRGRDLEYQLRTAELAAAAGVLGDAGVALRCLNAFKARSDRAPR